MAEAHRVTHPAPHPAAAPEEVTIEEEMTEEEMIEKGTIGEEMREEVMIEEMTGEVKRDIRTMVVLAYQWLVSTGMTTQGVRENSGTLRGAVLWKISIHGE